MSTLGVRETIRRQLLVLTGVAPTATPRAHRAGAHVLLAIALLLLVGNLRLGLAFANLIGDTFAEYDTLVGAVVFSFTVLSYLPHVALLVAPLLATGHVYRKWVACEKDAPAFARVLAATVALVAASALLLLPRPGASLLADAPWLQDTLPWVLGTQALVLPLAGGLLVASFRPELHGVFQDEDVAHAPGAEAWRVTEWNEDDWRPNPGLVGRVHRNLTFTRTAVPPGPPAYRATGHLLRGLCWTLLGSLLGGLLFFAFVLFLFLFTTADGPHVFSADAPHAGLLGVVVLFLFLTLGGLLGALSLVIAGNATYRGWVQRDRRGHRGALLAAAALLAAGLALLTLAPGVPIEGPILLGVPPGAAGSLLGAAGALLGALALRRDVRGQFQGA